jgi:hypothetical protein
MNRAMIVLFAALAVAACEEKKADAPAVNPAEAKNAAQTAQTAATPAPQPVAIADSDLVTPADFEETAEKAITKANYKTELASLETDISKE